MPDTTYTPDALRALTDDELRVVIAERLGWHQIEIRQTGTIIGLPPHDEYGCYDRVPNWPTDIAAVWELEGAIPEDRRRDYLKALSDIAVDRRRLPDWHIWAWEMSRATPRQRCEAYVLATNPREGA